MANRSTKKALLLSVLSMLLCLAMLVGTTFAWFTDSVTSGRNTIKAGNLDVVLEYWDGAKYVTVDENTKLFNDAALWEPGHTEVAYLKVSNAGTLALKYQLNVNVYEEVTGTNVAGEEFYLSDHLVFKVVDKKIETAADLYTRDTAVAAAGDVKGIKDRLGGNKTVHESGEKSLKNTGDADYVALIVYMPTSVGNEANYKTGTVAPSVTMGVNLVATQEVKESDFFNNTYDKDATYPVIGMGYTDVDDTAPYQELNAYNPKGGKVGWARVPTGAIADTDKPLTYTVQEVSFDENVTITSDQGAKTFEIVVNNIKEGNTETIEIIFEAGKGLTNIELYHKDVKLVKNVDFIYDPNTGDIHLYTTSFSPFTVVFDAEPEVKPDLPEDAPVAKVEDLGPYVDIPWETKYNIYPSSMDQKLDATYKFTAPHTSETIDNTKYADWYCDYYVMLKTDDVNFTELPEGYITLGGNYGDWGWIGFDNPEVATNVEIPLLGSVTHNPWTYRMVVCNVGEFLCGVGLTEKAGDALDGCEFVVMLRLTNPENENEFYNVNTVTYTFGSGDIVIE
ncbi:MAG: hypothetical protein IJA41_10385 [Clostridia bacterium]|nr:hypothetical protein [Clostridia bacterium]